MQVSVETTSQIERRITVQVPAAEVDEAVSARLQDTAKRVRLNGFRQGKIPMAVVRQRYGKDVRNEVVSELMRQHYVRAITEQSLNPAGYPSIEPKVDQTGKDLEFVATLEVYPEIELQSIDGTVVERPKTEIPDADIEPFEGGAAEGHELELGSNRFIPGFEEQLIGAKAGEEKRISVTFPEDYQAEHLAGQEATFKVTVHEVSAKALPEVDADFIKEFGVEDGDADKFRAEIKSNMEREVKQAAQNRVKQQALDALQKANDVTVPQSLVDQETEGLKRQAAQQFGLGEDFDVSQLPNELFADQARTRVKVGLLLAEVIKQHELDASDDEIRARAEELASQYQQPEQAVEQYMKNDELKGQIKSAVLEDKAVDKLLEQAQVNEVSMSYEQVLQAAQQAEQSAEEDEAEESDSKA